MKSILYIGAVLMTGASIYGFVDYKKSSSKADFSNLYEEKQEVIIPKESKNPAAGIKTEPGKKEFEKVITPVAPKKVKKPARPMKISVSPIPELKMAEPEKIPVLLEKTAEMPAPEASIIKENENAKKIAVVKKKKRVNHKMFSRAALDERYLEKELKMAPAKKTKH